VGGPLQRVGLLALPLPIGVVLVASALGWASVAPPGAFVAGICVQILQATTLFFGLANLRGGER
jgi:energy-converting hydrogenase Eha subunit C